MARVGFIDKELAHILRRHRQINLNISQAEIARRAKYENVQMVSYIETGRNPVPRDMRNRERIAKAYQLDITEFFRWCLIAELERDGTPPDLLLNLASEPLFGSQGEGPHPEDSGGHGDTGGHHPLGPNSGRPSITFADEMPGAGLSDIYRMPNVGIVRDILKSMAKRQDAFLDQDRQGDDQPVRGRSTLACQVQKLHLIMSRPYIKQTLAEWFRTVFSTGYLTLCSR